MWRAKIEVELPWSGRKDSAVTYAEELAKWLPTFNKAKVVDVWWEEEGSAFPYRKGDYF